MIPTIKEQIHKFLLQRIVKDKEEALQLQDDILLDSISEFQNAHGEGMWGPEGAHGMEVKYTWSRR